MTANNNNAAGRAIGRVTAWCGALALVGVLLACGQGSSAPAGAAGTGGGAPPPPEVGVVTVAPTSVSLSTELPGRVEALRVAQVRARVNGVVLKRLFREGSEVKAGQPLFAIDAASYQLHSTVPVRLRPAPKPIWPRPVPRPSASSRWSKPRHQQAGLRQCPGGAEAGRGRCRRGQGRGADRAHQPRLCHRHLAHCRPHRPRTRHRRCTGQCDRGHAAGRGAADQCRVRELHPVLERAPATAPGLGLGTAAARRRRSRRGACGARRRYRAAPPRQAAVFRPHGGLHLGPGDAARRSAQRRRRTAARAVRARAPGAGGAAGRHARAAASRHPLDHRRHRARGGCGQQARAEADQDSRRAERAVDRDRRAPARRAGHRRRFPEDVRAGGPGQAGAVAAAARARRQPGGHRVFGCGARCCLQCGCQPARSSRSTATWPASSSIAPSSRG